MTSDDRLDQLEPLVSEALNVLDRHTLQLKQLNGAVSQLATAVAQQGDNISFLLREQIAMKSDIAEIKADVAVLKTDMAGMKTDMAGMNGKIDLLVQLVQQQQK
jgi:chromosome segregation ATPase